MKNAIPLIETPRLLLRAHRLKDFPASLAMWTDPAVVKHIGGVPSTEQATWFRLMRYLGQWPLLNYGYWAIEEKATGSFAGDVGFADFKRELEPSIAGIPELGWALPVTMHGKGYATEAARAALEWADRNLTQTRTVCIINPENEASIRVAEKCGFAEYARTELMGQATILFERPRRIAA